MLAPRSEGQDGHDEDIEDRVVYEEYQIWKRNTPFYYEYVMTHALSWPCFTVEWLPESTVEETDDRFYHPILLGTHNPEGDNFVVLAKTAIPKEDALYEGSRFDSETYSFGGIGLPDIKLDIDLQIPHDGEINRIRYMPQQSSMLAILSSNIDVLLMDYKKYSQSSDSSVIYNTELLLRRHENPPCGLSWNPSLNGQLLSCSSDQSICLWDLNTVPQTFGVLEPTTVLMGHGCAINDVGWRYRNSSIFGSVDVNKRLMLWDLRTNDPNTPVHTVDAHSAAVRCLSFNFSDENLLATGSADKKIALWDVRNLGLKLHSFESHRSDIYNLEWSPHNMTLLGSASSDRRVHLWDISKIGEEQTPEDAIDGPPELLFIHAGHTSHVTDFSWNQHTPWLLASLSDDSILQVWQMAENVYNDEEPDLSPFFNN